jgi:hypothetical protein
MASYESLLDSLYKSPGDNVIKHALADQSEEEGYFLRSYVWRWIALWNRTPARSRGGCIWRVPYFSNQPWFLRGDDVLTHCLFNYMRNQEDSACAYRSESTGDVLEYPTVGLAYQVLANALGSIVGDIRSLKLPKDHSLLIKVVEEVVSSESYLMPLHQRK